VSEGTPSRGTLLKEAVAGLPGAIGSVPDGMAASVLAGVSPIHGLYASLAGPLVGGLTAGTCLMVITTTSAAALAAGSTLSGTPEGDRAGALALLTLLAGIFMVVAGLARLGRLTRFVANSVMVGFLTGIAVNIVLGQIPDLTGVDAEGSISLTKALFVLLHPSEIQVATLVAGSAALGIIALGNVLGRGALAALAALAIPSLVVALAAIEEVALVSDSGSIPTGVPLPALPDFSAFSLQLLAGAAAIAVIVLIQGSGVTEAAPNPDGSRSDANRDFIAQGLGNAASGLLQGQPVGGSVGQTSLNIAAGARTRWAAVFSGAWMAVILILFSEAVGQVVMSTLAAVLIFAAIGSIRTSAVMLTLRTSTISRIAVVATFVATMLLPVAAAVGIGVALSILLQLDREALDLRVVSLSISPKGSVVAGPAPETLESGSVTVLDIYGSLLFAGARTLEVRLPDPAGAVRPAVVLRLRGRTALTSTALKVLERYSERLEQVDGRLFLSGVDPAIAEKIQRGDSLEVLHRVEIETATDVLGESSRAAYRRAQEWAAGASGEQA
jgi:SulP family sulfate permease